MKLATAPKPFSVCSRLLEALTAMEVLQTEALELGEATKEGGGEAAAGRCAASKRLASSREGASRSSVGAPS